MLLKYICKLCNTECKNVISLNSHIQYNHKEYNTKKYYDEFYKKENEGFCKTCGNPTKFENFIKGYRNYCNNSCSHKTEHFRTSFNNSIQNKNEWIKNRINSIKTKSTNGIKISDNDLNKRHEKTKNYFIENLNKSNCEFISFEYNCNKIIKVSFRCNKCNRIHTKFRCSLDKKIRENDYNFCPICNFTNTVISKPEKELAKYISECYKGNILRNDRTILNGYELDIVIPEKKLAFEFDGTYWHMDPRIYKETDINVKLNKTAKEIWDFDNNKIKLCEQLGYKLIRIKEYDWVNDNSNVKQIIKQLAS